MNSNFTFTFANKDYAIKFKYIEKLKELHCVIVFITSSTAYKAKIFNDNFDAEQYGITFDQFCDFLFHGCASNKKLFDVNIGSDEISLTLHVETLHTEAIMHDYTIILQKSESEIKDPIPELEQPKFVAIPIGTYHDVATGVLNEYILHTKNKMIAINICYMDCLKSSSPVYNWDAKHGTDFDAEINMKNVTLNTNFVDVACHTLRIQSYHISNTINQNMFPNSVITLCIFNFDVLKMYLKNAHLWCPNAKTLCIPSCSWTEEFTNLNNSKIKHFGIFGLNSDHEKFVSSLPNITVEFVNVKN